MSSYIRKYIPFAKAEIQEFITYRAQAVVWVLMEFFYLALQFYIWKAIFENSTSDVISGYTFEGMVTYVFLIRIVFAITFVMPSRYISNDVRSGSIAMMLIKPIDYRMQLFFRSVGAIVNSLLFFVLPLTVTLVIIGFFIEIPLAIDPLTILFFILSVNFAFLIRFLVGYCFGLIIFLTINSFGIFQLRRAIEAIFSGALIPIAFFPPLLATIAKFLPFMHGLYVPVQIFMGDYVLITDKLSAIGIQVFWVGVLYLLSNMIWKRVIKRLVVMGG